MAAEGDEPEVVWSVAGASAPDLLTTVLGDYWFDRDDFIPSASLVSVLEEFAVSPDATRAALSRLRREGRLERRKDGRRTSYRLALAWRATAATRARALARFGTATAPWDGTWVTVAFSMPESERVRRSTLRGRLRALRMAPLVDGVWISPRPIAERVAVVLSELDVPTAVVLEATEIPRPGGMRPVDAWDLEALAARLDGFGARVDALGARVADGSLGASEALVVRTDLMARWRSLVVDDPRLPDALLPPSWPLRPLRARFAEVYDALGPLAELRVRQLAGVAPDDHGGPWHHRLDDLL